MRRLAVALLALLAAPPLAQAQRLVTSLSTHRVQVASNFTGTDVVVFGTVDLDQRTPDQDLPRFDVVVTVQGPKLPYVTRRKERVLGLWVNVDSRVFVAAPSYLAVMASRAFGEIASDEVLRRQRLGIANVPLLQRIGPDFADSVPDDAFRQAFVRRMGEEGLYRQDERGVTFLTATVFRAAVPLPANVPTGTFEIEVKLFVDGELVTRDATALAIDKVGFEQYVSSQARDHALLYGLAVALLALTTGWLASVVFRRD